MRLELFPIRYCTTGGCFLFEILRTEVFNEMQTEESIEAVSLTAPRPGRMQVDQMHVIGFGGWSVELETAPNK